MDIAQLQLQPHNTKIGGFELNIKTFKKTWEAEGFHWQQVICMDSTGEIPVDVNIGKKYNPLRGRTCKFHVTVAEIQPAEYLAKDRKKLVVHEFRLPAGVTFDESMAEADIAYQGEIKIIRSKIKCLLACHNGPKDNLTKLLVYLGDKKLDECVNRIIDG